MIVKQIILGVLLFILPIQGGTLSKLNAAPEKLTTADIALIVHVVALTTELNTALKLKNPKKLYETPNNSYKKSHQNIHQRAKYESGKFRATHR